MSAVIDDILRALHPLAAPPTGPGWNHDYLVELIGDAPRREAAVLVAIRDLPSPRMVFTRRRDDLAQHAGQVSFPGGRADPGDRDAVATALRESAEEIALDPACVEPLGFLDRLETVSGYAVTPVVARLAADARLAAQPDEVAEMFEVPLAVVLDPANIRGVDYATPWGVREVHEYVGVEPRIWGATTLMLMNLLRRMGRMP